MTALAQERSRRKVTWGSVDLTLTNGTKGYRGGMACIDTTTGKVVPGSASTTLFFLGYFKRTADATGGEVICQVDLDKELNLEWFANATAGDAVAATDVGKVCYILDDQTVTITATGHSPAGVVMAVSATDGVLVNKEIKAIGLITNPTISDFTNAAHNHSGASSGGTVRLATGGTLAFVANALTIATPGKGTHYKVPATAGNSVITLGTTGAARGDEVVFTANGTDNGHTVTYNDGATAITAAATASKRHRCVCTFDGTNWMASLVVGP